jgi:tetratricopeptide (TPR) repeat protein
MAADEFVKWKPDEPPFRLSLIIDTETRAKKTFMKKSRSSRLLGRRLREEQSPESLFGRYSNLAIRYFREAAQRDHTYATAHNNLACVFFLKSEFSSAVGELDRAVGLDPSSPEAFNNRAVAYFKLGSRLKVDLKGKTESDLLKAVELKSDYADALFNLAYFYKLDNRNKQKDIYYKRFAAHSSDKELLDILR